MTRFIQLHLLTSYAPANLNRDDLGRPKTAIMGGKERLRISSQSLKRAWRTSEVMKQALDGHIGTRTKLLGCKAFDDFIQAGIKEKDAKEWAAAIAKEYGKLKSEVGKELEIEQLVHISPEEQAQFDALVKTLITEKRAPKQDELDRLLQTQHAVDIAMFGRMLASKPDHNEDAAIQVAHAIGVHASAIEDDYFTAVDDLNKELKKDDSGAAHIGESGFAAAVFYQYICIDRDQLKKNLGDDETLTEKSIKAITETALTVGPSGKQNSFASRARAHYALAEKGSRQPRSLSLAFLQPVEDGDDFGTKAVKKLKDIRKNMDVVYGDCADDICEFNVLDATGSAKKLIDFAATV